MVSQSASNVTKTASANASDSCTWYSGERCAQPRTGYDCLNVLLDTNECAIDPNGACVSMSVYEQYLTDREYFEPLLRYFPASNYTYCSANDSVCSNCIEEWASDYEATGIDGSPTYCTGLDGCVCVAVTEVPSWQQTVIANQCDGSSNSSEEFSSGTRICIILALCVGALMVFAVFVMRRCIRTGTRNSGSTHHPSSGPQLNLTAWKSLREKLIETEHTFVNGDTARLDATARTAEALAEAPTVTVELTGNEEDVQWCTTKVEVSLEEQVAMASSSSSNGSSSLEAEVTASSNVSTRGDSCAWYADESCERSRTCYDCLNVGIVGDSCAVGDIGQCLSVSKQVEGKTYYLASSVTYCAASDEVCTTCRTRWLQEYAASGEVQSSAVCMGENKCVCLAVCERETRNSVVIQHECPAYERARVGSIMLVIAMGVAAFIVFSMITFCLKKLLRCALPWLDRDPSDQSILARRRPPRSPRGPQLSLSGWKSMREKLIETEHGNGMPSAGPSGVMRIQLSATEGTSVIVEEGEGYRPDSPSGYHRQGPEDVVPALAMLR